MKKELKLVKDFHKKFKVPVAKKPKNISKDRFAFRYNFLLEEIKEYKRAVEKGEIEEIAKELADIFYVLDGIVLEHGLQDKMADIFKEVHFSNMSKDFDQYKMKKREKYFKANIKKFFK